MTPDFTNLTLPDKVNLQPGITINNVPKFIESHVAMVNGGDEPWREVYRYRLELLYKILTEK